MKQRILLIVLLVAPMLPAMSTEASFAAEAASMTGATAVAQEIWRLDRALKRWEQRCQATELGGSGSADDLSRDARRLAAALSGLETHASKVESEQGTVLRRKLQTLRSRLSSLDAFGRSPGIGPCMASTCGHDLGAIRPRIIEVASYCGEATSVAEETVAWQFPSPAGSDLTTPISGEAWILFEPSHDGEFEAHTGGSMADTEIAVFETCFDGAEPIAANDDMLGLQSAVRFAARAGDSRWIRVRQRVGAAVDPVFLTLGGEATGISGVVTEATTGDAIYDTRVEIRIRETGGYAGSAYTDSNGAYTVSGLSGGVYVAVTEYSDEHLDELWDDHPCHDSCDVTTGDPIDVFEGRVTSGIDFGLLRAGAISGRLRDAETGEVLAGFEVRVDDMSGSSAGYAYTDAAGRYTVGGLSPGVHFAYTDGYEYRNEVYDDIPCLPHWPYCEPEDGTPIQVVAEEVVQGIDFDLDRLGSISGALVDASSGMPIQFAEVRFYDATGDSVEWASTDEIGQYLAGGFAEGTYFVTTDLYSGYRNEVFDDIPCSGSGGGDCDPLGGTPVSVSLGETTPGIDFALDPLGVFTGQVIDELSGTGIPFVEVRSWTQSGGWSEDGRSNALGVYVVEDLADGSYFATTDADDGHLNELYDDLPCWGSSGPGCDPTTGTPIAVALGEVTSGIDFALALGGAVAGSLADAFTGDPIMSRRVELWSASGTLVGYIDTDTFGNYRIDTLPGGLYFVSSHTFGDYLDELYDDLPCPGGAPDGCDPTTGTPISVTAGVTTAGVDIDLVLRGGLSGSIMASSSGEPLPGVGIDVWDDGGQHVATGATNVAGVYQVDLSSGYFYVSTDVGHGYRDEIYDDVPCPDGPAILGLCDPLSGNPVEVTGANPAVRGIDFVLVSPIFMDGFESGDTSAWSSTVP